jgi:hypothetical protein
MLSDMSGPSWYLYPVVEGLHLCILLVICMHVHAVMVVKQMQLATCLSGPGRHLKFVVQGRKGAALAHVTGHITVTGLGPLGAAMAPVLNFAEAFTVERGTDSKVKIINQIFKMLPT